MWNFRKIINRFPITSGIWRTLDIVYADSFTKILNLELLTLKSFAILIFQMSYLEKGLLTLSSMVNVHDVMSGWAEEKIRASGSTLKSWCINHL